MRQRVSKISRSFTKSKREGLARQQHFATALGDERDDCLLAQIEQIESETAFTRTHYQRTQLFVKKRKMKSKAKAFPKWHTHNRPWNVALTPRLALRLRPSYSSILLCRPTLISCTHIAAGDRRRTSRSCLGSAMGAGNFFFGALSQGPLLLKGNGSTSNGQAALSEAAPMSSWRMQTDQVGPEGATVASLRSACARPLARAPPPFPMSLQPPLPPCCRCCYATKPAVKGSRKLQERSSRCASNRGGLANFVALRCRKRPSFGWVCLR